MKVLRAFLSELRRRRVTMVGEYAAAAQQLEYLLSVPGPHSAAMLRVDPTWDALRDHPRFQKLLEQQR